jgi:hypothetical protein
MNGDFFEDGNHGDEGTWLVWPGKPGGSGKVTGFSSGRSSTIRLFFPEN